MFWKRIGATLRTFMNIIILRRWIRSFESTEALGNQLSELGFTKVRTRNSTIYTSPSGKGRFELFDSRVIIHIK